MNEQTQTVLNILAEVWAAEARPPEVINADDVSGNALAQGYREAKRECADALKMLVILFTPREL